MDTMRFVLVGVLLLGACGGERERYPVNPGGGGGPPGLGGGVRDPGGGGGDDDDDPPVDAPEDPGDAMPLMVSGRACQITDLRQPRGGPLGAGCSATEAGNITVKLAGNNRSTETTAMDGTFTIGSQLGMSRYVFSRADGIETIAPFRGDGHVSPFMNVADYQTLLTANGLSVGGGAFVIEIVNAAGQPIAGATASLVGSLTLYDANDPLVWSAGGTTGPQGVAWIPAIMAAGPMTVSVASGATNKNVTIESFDSQTMTHVLVTFP
jgi:hypothetical protein